MRQGLLNLQTYIKIPLLPPYGQELGTHLVFVKNIIENSDNAHVFYVNLLSWVINTRRLLLMQRNLLHLCQISMLLYAFSEPVLS